MAVSARKRLNNDKYNAKCTQINLKPLTPEANAIKAAAKASGQSIQGYILQAVRERMAKEGQPLTLDDLPGADSAGGGIGSLYGAARQGVRRGSKIGFP